MSEIIQYTPDPWEQHRQLAWQRYWQEQAAIQELARRRRNTMIAAGAGAAGTGILGAGATGIGMAILLGHCHVGECGRPGRIRGPYAGVAVSYETIRGATTIRRRPSTALDGPARVRRGSSPAREPIRRRGSCPRPSRSLRRRSTTTTATITTTE